MPAFGGQIPERPASRPKCSYEAASRRSSSRPAARPAGRPDGGGHEREGGRGDRDRQQDDALPREHGECLVERAVEARPGNGDAAVLLRAEVELDRGVLRFGGGRRVAHTNVAQGRPRLRPLLLETRALDVGLGPFDRGGERCDAGAQLLLAPVERVERLLEVVDLDVLPEDRAEAGQPGHRVRGVARRHPERHRRDACVPGCVVHGDDVAAKVTGDRERLLGGGGERVRVVDLEGERGAVALGAVADRARGGLLGGRRVGRRWRRCERVAGRACA